MRIAYITAGAAGMFCGSCLHDNTLVSALQKMGHDALLIPTYTPITTDEHDVSQKRVFFGGINVFLQQKSALFRKTPWFLDRMLDGRWLLNLASSFAVKTRAEVLGDLAVSMLKGEHGYQKKELDKLVTWLADDVKPQIINLTNVLLSGMVPTLKARLKVPIVATLQGDDVFLESLPPAYRAEAIALIKNHCKEFDGFVTTSRYYADFMAGYLELPRHKIDVVYPGLDLKGHGSPRPMSMTPPFNIGYFARICREKGVHVLAEAYRLLVSNPANPPAKLWISGWLGSDQYDFFRGIMTKLIQEHNLRGLVEYQPCPDHAAKIRYLQNLAVLSVPTTYREPKGLYILEALANGVPVVQPRHGSFPELIEATGGGILVNPDDPADLARGLYDMLCDHDLRRRCGEQGKEIVHSRFTAANMARETLSVYEKYL
jgi:glycosyltransferase involved in cell wall biosynthesis